MMRMNISFGIVPVTSLEYGYRTTKINDCALTNAIGALRVET
jgi:hypothetical protein